MCAGDGLLEDKEIASLGCAMYQKGAEFVEQIYEAFLAMACNVMRELWDSRWAPEEVQFSRTKPADVSGLSPILPRSLQIRSMVTKCPYVSIVALGSMGKWIGLKCNLYGCRTAVIYLQQTGMQ